MEGGTAAGCAQLRPAAQPKPFLRRAAAPLLAGLHVLRGKSTFSLHSYPFKDQTGQRRQTRLLPGPATCCRAGCWGSGCLYSQPSKAIMRDRDHVWMSWQTRYAQIPSLPACHMPAAAPCRLTFPAAAEQRQTLADENPFAALVLSGESPLCTGALVAPQAILTAASCSTGASRPELVFVGVLNAYLDPFRSV